MYQLPTTDVKVFMSLGNCAVLFRALKLWIICTDGSLCICFNNSCEWRQVAG